MKTNPEPDDLLKQVLSDAASEEFRTASLQQTLAAAHQRKTTRRVMRAGAAIALCIGVVTLLFSRSPKPSQPPMASNPPSAPSDPTVPGTSIRVVGDDELLAMFPDRPVALVGPPEKRQLVFLDEQRSKGHSRPGLNL